jgi:hypothetical protein
VNKKSESTIMEIIPAQTDLVQLSKHGEFAPIYVQQAK